MVTRIFKQNKKWCSYAAKKNWPLLANVTHKSTSINRSKYRWTKYRWRERRGWRCATGSTSDSKRTAAVDTYKVILGGAGREMRGPGVVVVAAVVVSVMVADGFKVSLAGRGWLMVEPTLFRAPRTPLTLLRLQ